MPAGLPVDSETVCGHGRVLGRPSASSRISAAAGTCPGTSPEDGGSEPGFGQLSEEGRSGRADVRGSCGGSVGRESTGTGLEPREVFYGRGSRKVSLREQVLKPPTGVLSSFLCFDQVEVVSGAFVRSLPSPPPCVRETD